MTLIKILFTAAVLIPFHGAAQSTPSTDGVANPLVETSTKIESHPAAAISENVSLPSKRGTRIRI